MLPNVDDKYSSDLHEYLDQHGKWAVAILAIRALIALTTNTVAFNQELCQLQTAFMLLQVAAAVFYLLAKRREHRIAVTVLFGLALFATMRTIYV